MIDSKSGAKCILCQIWSEFEALTQINVRDKGRLLFIRYVHPACYAKDPEYVKKACKGKNPKFFVMGCEVK